MFFVISPYPQNKTLGKSKLSFINKYGIHNKTHGNHPSRSGFGGSGGSFNHESNLVTRQRDEGPRDISYLGHFAGGNFWRHTQRLSLVPAF